MPATRGNIAMVEEIKLPEISENVESGEVIEVLVKIGDFIEAEQSVVELETEKAAFEVPSPVKGKVIEINIKQGQEVKVGQTLVKVDTDAAPEPEKTAPAEEPKAEEAEEEKESLAEEKTVEKPPTKKRPQQAEVKEPAPEVEQSKPAEKETAPTSATAPASPSVRQLARELGIDINKVPGGGPGGRISTDDVKSYAKSLISGTPAAAGQPKKQVKALPDFTKWGDIERKAMTAIRKKISDTLSYTWSNVPQVTQYEQADITTLEEFRHQYSQQVEQAGGRLTITSILLKVVASALKEFPLFNASVDAEGEEIIYKKYFNIAVAVDTDRGLLVPVIRDADKKSILGLSVELTQLAEKTRQHKISPDDMVGGNFTISNLGGIGGTNFAPIIYWPQVAILGIARAGRRPVYVDGRLEPRLILPLSLSYDHRIIDGTDGLRFIKWIAEKLEKPFLLVMQEGAE
jgi:pyruvate dehydrogenase E2 component (dihydrolipoamide acetyltransferase)